MINDNFSQYRICKWCGKEYWWEKDQPNYHENNQWVNSTLFCCHECGMEYVKQKRRDTYAKKTKEEKLEHSRKTKEGISKRTEQQIKESNRKRANTCLEKYGVARYLDTEEGKAKVKEAYLQKTDEELKNIQKKRENTKLIKYGNAKYIAVNKIRETRQKNIQNDPEYYTKIYKKAQNTYLKRYGVDSVSKIPSVKEKKAEKQRNLTIEEKRSIAALTKQTLIDRYGEDYAKLRTQKAEETCMQRYGMKSILLPNVRNASNGNNSGINKLFADILKQNNIDYSREFVLGTYSYDFKIGNILVELNPTITHFSTDICIGHYKAKSKDYHYNKSKFALDNGYRCICIWDWDNIDKVIDIFKEKTVLYARNLNIKEVNKCDCDIFLNTYHLQNTCKGQDIRLGLYLNDELVEIITFGKPRYTKKYEYELLRLCTKSEYRIVGGAERLFKEFLHNYQEASVISYCDTSKFSGDVYNRLGMTLVESGKPSKHWYNISTHRHITDNLLRKNGYSQLHKDTIHKKGENNETLMLENGYLEIYDCGQETYIWKK